LNRALQQIRRAAGPLRDLDVMTDRLRTLDSSAAVVEQLRAERREAEPRLCDELTDLEATIAPAVVDQLLKRTRWRGDQDPPSWIEFAQHALAERFVQFQAAAQEKPTAIEPLHQLRILGKRLRYTMELVVSLNPAIRTELYSIVEHIQDKLGQINDYSASIERLRAMREAADDSALRRTCKRILRAEKASLEHELSTLPAWWNATPLGELQRRWYAVFGGQPIGDTA
jgi:CHAD domain-containing protein